MRKSEKKKGKPQVERKTILAGKGRGKSSDIFHPVIKLAGVASEWHSSGSGELVDVKYSQHKMTTIVAGIMIKTCNRNITTVSPPKVAKYVQNTGLYC